MQQMEGGRTIFTEDAERIEKMLMRPVVDGNTVGSLLVMGGATLARASDDAPVDEALLIRQCERLRLAPGAHA